MTDEKLAFLDWMKERRAVDRWFVIKVAMAGAFMGALIAVSFILMGFNNL